MKKTIGEDTMRLSEEVIRTSGSTLLCSDLSCKELFCQGSTKCPGNVTVRGAAHVSGATSIGGDFCCASLQSVGSLHIKGTLKAESIDCGGNFLCDGALAATKLQSCGSFSAKQTVRANTITAQGSFSAGGDVFAEAFLKLSMSAPVRLKKVESETVVLQPQRDTKRRLILMERVFARKMAPIFTVEEISAQNAEVSFAKVGIIRANTVQIGQNSVVDLVFYSDTLLIDQSAKVREVHRITEQTAQGVG